MTGKAASSGFRTRILAQHRGGLDGGRHDYLFFDGTVVYRDSLGRHNRGAWHRWGVCICNNPGCVGRVIVALDDLDAVASAALPAPVTP